MTDLGSVRTFWNWLDWKYWSNRPVLTMKLWLGSRVLHVPLFLPSTDYDFFMFFYYPYATIKAPPSTPRPPADLPLCRLPSRSAPMFNVLQSLEFEGQVVVLLMATVGAPLLIGSFATDPHCHRGQDHCKWPPYRFPKANFLGTISAYRSSNCWCRPPCHLHRWELYRYKSLAGHGVLPITKTHSISQLPPANLFLASHLRLPSRSLLPMANSPPSAPPFLVIATVYRAEIHFGTLQAIGLDRLGCLNMVTNYPNRPELFIQPTILSWFILNSTISTLFHTVFQRFVV